MWCSRFIVNLILFHKSDLGSDLSAEFCDGRVCLCVCVCVFVCLCVCLSARISLETHVRSLSCACFCACYLWPRLGPPLTASRYVIYFRFMDDVTLAHKPRQLNVAHMQSRTWLSCNGPITIAIRARFEYDSSTIQHLTRSYVLSSNNEHVNSFALL